ncbi:MAG: hypothetical protein H0X33_00360 [Taibaiella sp.]|nr:hypothetical protein [Taibaiella sp.]
MDNIIFRVADSAQLILKAKQLCHDIYLQQGYITRPYPNRIIPMGDTNAVYIVAITPDKEVKGTIRLSRQDPFSILHLWRANMYVTSGVLIQTAKRSICFSIGGLAVAKEYAGLKISWGLYNMAYNWALTNNMAYGIITMDQRAFRSLKMVGWHAEQVADPVYYFGSLTIPAIIPIAEQPRNMIFKQKPHFQYFRA